MTTPRRYAFIVPRFGEGIIGGAETLVGELACRLAARGDSIHVLTTCARDNRTWENSFPEGESIERGVRVRRFRVDSRDLEKWIPLQIGISEGMRPGVDDQLTWMTHSVNSSGLYEYLRVRHDEYDALFFAPYLFGTTFWGAMVAPERSFLIPCLHDEHYAYLDIIRSMFRQVRGGLFNAIPEYQLACSLYGQIPGGEVGMGFEFEPFEREDLKPFFADRFPYILYAGRKETGKNVQILIDHFCAGKDSGKLPAELKLVVAGGGSFSDLHRPAALLRGDVVDLSQVTDEEKLRLMKHALVLGQLSTNESFSIVLMESWLLGTPVVVHSQCAVTRHHAVESGGGLYAQTAEEFCAVIRQLCEEPELRDRLGDAGRAYVRQRYNWSAVLGRFDAVMERLGIGGLS